MKKKILIVTSEFPPQPGGIGNHGFQLANHLHKNNYAVSVLTDNRSKNGKEEKIFDKAVPFSVYRIPIKSPRFFMYLNRLLALFKLIKKNEVIIASGKFSLWIVAFTTFFYSKKTIAIVHGSEVNFSNKFLKQSIHFSLKRFSTIIAVSNFTKSLIAHLNLSNIVVIENAINQEDWNKDAINNIPLRGNPKLITVGNVTNRKGQLNVIKQIPYLIKKYPDLHYHCVGIPTQKNEFLNQAKALKVADKITFHGAVSQKKLKEILNSSDIFVMLSSATEQGDVEGFGIAILEANMLGIPAIGAKGCGIEDAIKNNFSGVLITASNKNEFETAIDTILQDYNSFKNNSIAWAKKHTWDQTIKKYIQLIAH
jgi:phosphatidylinositol alpha-1,6-mannosyltransferase